MALVFRFAFLLWLSTVNIVNSSNFKTIAVIPSSMTPTLTNLSTRQTSSLVSDVPTDLSIQEIVYTSSQQTSSVFIIPIDQSAQHSSTVTTVSTDLSIQEIVHTSSQQISSVSTVKADNSVQQSSTVLAIPTDISIEETSYIASQIIQTMYTISTLAPQTLRNVINISELYSTSSDTSIETLHVSSNFFQFGSMSSTCLVSKHKSLQTSSTYVVLQSIHKQEYFQNNLELKSVDVKTVNPTDIPKILPTTIATVAVESFQSKIKTTSDEISLTTSKATIEESFKSEDSHVSNINKNVTSTRKNYRIMKNNPLFSLKAIRNADGSIDYNPAPLNNTLKINLELHDVNNGDKHDIDFYLFQDVMKQFGLTKDEVSRGLVVGDDYNVGLATGLRLRGKNYALWEYLKPDTGIFMSTADLEPYSLYLEKVPSFEELNSDCTLVPEPNKVQDWTEPRHQFLEELDIQLKYSVLNITIKAENHTQHLNVSSQVRNKDHDPYGVWQDNAGICLTVINIQTSRVTLQQIFPTSASGGHRDLTWTLKSISPGRLVILASLFDGSIQLVSSARRLLEKLGSSWISEYLYKDQWVWVFVSGGSTLTEAILPNFDGPTNIKLPSLMLHLNFGHLYHELKEKQRNICPSWPDTKDYQHRHQFCMVHDGYGDLCSCENPFMIPNVVRNLHMDPQVHVSEDIPILILAGDRTRYLFRLLQSLRDQSGVHRSLITIITDGPQDIVDRLGQVLDLTVLVHRPEGVLKASRISRALRFGLYHMLHLHPTATKFIVLEDDLILSPDFYIFMQQAGKFLEMDSSLYCVSAFNYLSYSHTAMDVSALYRVQDYPAYGWMTTRDVITDFLPKWLPSTRATDWDYMMGSTVFRSGRECLVPDINRSYHGGAVGTHFTPSFSTERDYLARTYNHIPDVKLMDPKHLMQETYEQEMTSLIKKAKPLQVDDPLEINLSQVQKGEIYVIYIQKDHSEDELSFRIIGLGLDIWHHDGRATHHHTWRLHYHGATLFVVGVPLSKYASLMPAGYNVFRAIPEDETELKLYGFQRTWNTKVYFHDPDSTNKNMTEIIAKKNYKIAYNINK